MRAKKYTTKKGRQLYKPVLSEDEYPEGGFCLACGIEVFSGVEPDARKYPCESCGEDMVYGVEELALTGLVEVE